MLDVVQHVLRLAQRPHAARAELAKLPVRALKRGRYDVAIVAVAHRQFRELGARGVRALCKPKHVLYDVKHVFPASAVDGRL